MSRPDTQPRFLPVLGAGLALTLAAASVMLAWSELNLAIARSHMQDWWYSPSLQRRLDAQAALGRAGPLVLSRAELHLMEGELRLIEAMDVRDPGDFEPAVRQFTAGVRARPLWPDGHAWLAVALARAGDREAAAAALRRGLELGPRAGRMLKIFDRHAAPISAIADLQARTAIFALADRVSRRQPAWTHGVMQRLGWAMAWCARDSVPLQVERRCLREAGG